MTPDPAALAEDLGELVRVPSVTGGERAAIERFAELAERRGLRAAVIVHDLAALRAHPDHPGEEAPRDELVGAEAVLPGRDPSAPRLCLNGHLDVVDPGEAGWSFDPWAGDVREGRLRGRGAADMKGGVVAALHALATLRSEGVRPRGDVVLQAVASEEDGGLGTFAALERDDRFAAALIPEPTAFDVVCAQAGALTFAGEVPGVSAHAALRRRGISAIDRYVAIHAALHEHERAINADPGHPLMAQLDLPYPVSVGRVEGGTWSSTVPDRLRFEGRVGVRVGETPGDARAALEAAVRDACPEARVGWTGGQFAPGATPHDHPFVELVAGALAAESGRPARRVGSPYGADMRLFCARGIPCVMAGTGGIELAHAVDESVALDEVAALARALTAVVARLGDSA